MNQGYVYILQSQKTEKYYVGSSKDPVNRLEEHNSGKTKSTRNKGPWEMKLVQSYENMQKARQVEVKIKKLKRRDYVERMIKEQQIKIGL